MKDVRRAIFIITLFFVLFGVIMVYSSSAIYALDKYGDSMFFLKKHLWFVLFGFLLMFYLMSVELSAVQRISRALMMISVGLLVLVLIPGLGVSVGGARRWFRIAGAISFQPSELAKIALIVYLAGFMDRKGYRIKDLTTGYIPSMAVVGMVSLLILAQPDLGTAIAVFFIGVMIIFISGGSIRYLMATALMGLPALYYSIFSVPYRRKRMLVFLNPWQDRDGSGFQIIQSFLALGSGGLLGVGLGQSKQKLFYLPESHTDFIFSIIGEELGFVGCLSLVVLFAIFAWLGVRAFLKEFRTFRKMIIFGVTSMIAFEALVNMAVTIGALPTKGLPLPFISYGGSSLVFHMAAVGLMLNAMRD